MSDFRPQLLARAFRVVPGPAFNRVRQELIRQADVAPVIYEIMLPPTGSWEAFRDATFPLLVRYLRSQGIDPEEPRLLVAAVFFNDRFHLIEGRELMRFLMEMEGLNPQALHFRVLQWLARTEPDPKTS
ncbi:MAG: hypothetical protein D6766_08615 [Verrucomicrobia bacterium]|nr:MAG: hypothetical protein D6766_08615 [Verrucomicrobiota bacterium]